MWCSGQGWQLLTFIGVNHRPWSQPICRDHKWTNSNLCVQKSAFVQSSAYRFCSECSMPIRWQIVGQSSKTGYYSNSCLIAWVAAKDYQKYSSRLRRTRRRTGHFKLSYLACLAGPSIILLHLVVSGCGIDTMLWLWWQHFWHKKATHFGCCRTSTHCIVTVIQHSAAANENTTCLQRIFQLNFVADAYDGWFIDSCLVVPHLCSPFPMHTLFLASPLSSMLAIANNVGPHYHTTLANIRCKIRAAAGLRIIKYNTVTEIFRFSVTWPHRKHSDV